MKKIILVLVILISNLTLGQNGTFERGGFSNIGSGNSSVVNYTNLSDGIVGNKYFTNSWSIGYLEINDSIKSPQAKIQYDLVNGELLIGTQNNKNGFVILDKTVTGFSMDSDDGKKYFVRKKKSDFVDSSIEKEFFLNPFPINNKQYILVGLKKVLTEPSAARNGYTSTSLNKKYKKYTSYYVLNSDKKYMKVKLKEKDILKVLSDKKKELKKYTKTNNLNLKKENDVVKLMTYYHSL